MKWTARSLIANEQGGPCLLLSVAPHQPRQYRTLTALVVHATSVFFSRQKLEILYPFISMLTTPANLAVSYMIVCMVARLFHDLKVYDTTHWMVFSSECLPSYDGRRSPTRSKEGSWRKILWYANS